MWSHLTSGSSCGGHFFRRFDRGPLWSARGDDPYTVNFGLILFDMLNISIRIFRSSFPALARCRGRYRLGFVALSLISIFGGCALTQEVSKTPRNAIEQLLLSQAAERVLDGVTVPIRAHFHIDERDPRFGVIDSPSWDLAFVRDLVAGRLGQLGYPVQKPTVLLAFVAQ